MKLKTDFVTNSSSTSFIVWGVILEEEEIIENCSDIIFKYMKKSKYHKDLTREEFNDMMDEDDIIDEFINVCENVKLDCSATEYDSSIMIGKSPFEMKDDETLYEFKTNIIKSLQKINITNITKQSLDEISECWYDG